MGKRILLIASHYMGVLCIEELLKAGVVEPAVTGRGMWVQTGRGRVRIVEAELDEDLAVRRCRVLG